MKKTTRGSIQFSSGNEDPTSSSLPNIISFQFVADQNNLNKFTLYFEVENYATLILERSLLDQNGNQIALSNESKVDNTAINVGENSKSFNKDKNYQTKFRLIATNKNGSTVSELSPIEVGNANLNIFDENLITDFSAERSLNSYDEVDIKFKIQNITDFNIKNLDQLELRYRRQDFKTDLSIILNKNEPIANLDASGKIESYSFSFSKLKMQRQSVGGFFNFLCRVTVKDFQSQDSDSKLIYYPDLDISQPALQKNSRFPEAQILDPKHQASLRYEFLVKFSEIFIHKKNILSGSEQEQPPQFEHRFLDSSEVAKLTIDNYLIKDESSNYLFYYEFNYNRDHGTKGYFYPASVSDILPCIIVNKNNNSNDSIILFWKINNNFFDYQIVNENISITTTSFEIKLQYKQGASYTDITESIVIDKSYFQNSTQKFILEIKKTKVTRLDLFNLVNELDNATDNLKIVVVSHTVLCSAKGVSSKELTFDKLLIPDQWIYIAYNKYILDDNIVRNSSDSTISLNLDDLSIRGIRLPDKGFKKFDTISNIKNLVQDQSTQTPYVSTFDLSVFYKLSCSFNGFYLDPIKEGTVNSIILPKIPDDVFLVPPKVVVPPPNFKKIADGGIQAEAVVNLNEYGKISAIQITDIGEGYSLFKTALSKREQTFSDLTPVVKSTYTILASNNDKNKQALIPKNLSFDLENLKASLSGGVRLSSVLADKAKIDSGSDGGNPLSEIQKIQLNEYLQDYLPENATIEDNSVESYSVKSESINNEAEDILDQTWYDISKLYTEKYNNPLFETVIYNEDDDAATATIDESGPSQNIASSADSATLTPTSIDTNSEQTSASGGEWELFELNGLVVMPDGSPAITASNAAVSPPWLTLLPISQRSDGMYSFGPLPNMAPRAEMFNRIVGAINSLNEVRIEAPFIWLVNQRSKLNVWLKSYPEGQSEFTIVEFSKEGTKIQSINNINDYYLPINSSLSVSAGRSVGKVEKKSGDVKEFGLTAGTYISSSEDSSSLKFKPTVHPFMVNALAKQIRNKIKRRYLGLVTEGVYSCSSIKPAKSPGQNFPVIYCPFLYGDGAYEKIVPNVSLPYSKFKTDVKFEFFDAGGSIDANAYGTAKAFQIPIGKKNGYQVYCGTECGDSYYKSIDFTYTNMYPATYKL